jgi:beta-lactam-binding protein with PASTA domain
VFKFITHRPLWFNILAGIILAGLIFGIFFLSLNWMTNHGSSSTVPSVTGKKFEDARKLLVKSGFDIEIQDSVYVDSLPPMSVIKQIPDGDEVVKSNRTVYLILNRSVPPIVEMPDLTGYSYRNAEMVLKNMDLRIGDTTFKPDFAKNAVLEQLYKGSIIAPGAKIRKGSVISLVLGDGVGKREFIVPVITGMTFSEAKEMLEGAGLGVGAIVAEPNVKDTMSAWIYRQNPERFDDEKRILRIRSGQLMDVWLQVEKPAKDSTGNSDKDNDIIRKPEKKTEKPDNKQIR